jgi:hypothetical protein
MEGGSTMSWKMIDTPDTLPFAEQVRLWMETHWRHGPCPVCGDDNWNANPKIFLVPHAMPVLQTEKERLAEEEHFSQFDFAKRGVKSVDRGFTPTGSARGVFLVVCDPCGYIVWISARSEIVAGSPIPDDISGIDPGG